VLLFKETQDSKLGLMFASCDAVAERLANQLIEGDAPIGAVLLGVHKDSCAALAGLGAFDVVTMINGATVASARQALRQVRRAVGPMKICFQRCPARHLSAAVLIQRTWRSARGLVALATAFGVARRDLATCIAFDINMPTALVTHVCEASALATKLNVGDVVLSIDGEMPRSGRHAVELVQATPPGKVIQLLCKQWHTFNREELDLGVRTTAAAVDAAFEATLSEECAICMETMSEPTPWHAGCGHHFCKGCTTNCAAIAEACPICRATWETRQKMCPLVLLRSKVGRPLS